MERILKNAPIIPTLNPLLVGSVNKCRGLSHPKVREIFEGKRSVEAFPSQSVRLGFFHKFLPFIPEFLKSFGAGAFRKFIHARHFTMRNFPLFLLLCPLAFGADVYVAQTSAGADDGSSCAAARAKSSLIAGDWAGDTTIHLCGTITGTAGQTAITALGSGTSGHPVTVIFDSATFGRLDNSAYWGGATSGAITLNGQSWITVDLGTVGIIDNLANGSGLANQSVSTGIYLSNCQHCTVQGSGGAIMSMYRHTQGWDNNANALLTAGVKVAASSNVSVTGVRVVDSGYGIQNVWANGDANISITNNKIRFSNEGIFASGAGTVTGLAITGNEILDAVNWFQGTTGVTYVTTTYRQTGIHIAATGASQVASGPVITGNWVHGRMGSHLGLYSALGNGPDSAIALIWLEQSGSGSISSPLVANNRLESSLGSAENHPDTFILAGGTSAQIINNTMASANVAYSTCLKFGPGSGNFQNNICSAMKTGVNLLSGTLTSDNNDLSGLSTTAAMISGVTTYATVTAWTSATGKDASSSTGSPLLAYDQTLKSGSAAINLGANLTSLLTTDYLGNARPGSGAWEAGAYEWTANSTDYWVNWEYGSTTLYQRYDGYTSHKVLFASTIGFTYFMNTTGPATAVQITGLPTGLTATITCMSGPSTFKTSCFGASAPFYQQNSGTPGFFAIHLAASSSLPVGDYVITLQTRVNGFVHDLDIPIRVLATPTLPSPGTYSPGGIPGIPNWEAKMLSDGDNWCLAGGVTNPSTMTYSVEQQVWYYDGARAYYQLADYTGNPYWTACAINLANAYADQALSAGFGYGNRVFTRGLRMAYERTGTQKFKDAINRLAGSASGSPYAVNGGTNQTLQTRETALILNAYVDAELLGTAHNPLAERSVAFLLADFDAFFGRHNYPALKASYDNQPFWDGLAAQALIYYYDNITPDPRIPVAIKQYIDFLWLDAWNHTTNQMLYGMEIWNGGQPTTLLNNLMVPAFAWYYKTTHNADPNYLTWGDNLWSHALDTDPSFSGKEFSQNWMWSFDYLTWRNATDPATSILSTPNLSFSNTTVGITSSAQTITVTNTGNATLNIASVVKAGSDFTKSADTCGATLASTAFCTISVTFTPGSYGAKTGSITITDDAGGVGGSTQAVSLSGLGTIITLSPLSLTFAPANLGITSAAQVVTMTNHSGSTITFSGITFPLNPATQYANTTTCGATLADNASCTISVTFTPSTVGVKLGTLRIADNALGSPRDIPLVGAGAPINDQGATTKGARLKGANVH